MAEYVELQAAERECLNAVRESDREAADILERRHEEEERIAKAMRDSEQRPPGTFHAYTPKHLLVSNYDTTRAKISVDDRVEGGDDKKTTRDYLTPFLPSYARRDGHALSRVDAIKVRDDCLEAFKERLVERANIVQARLDEENAAFSKRQAAFQRKPRQLGAGRRGRVRELLQGGALPHPDPRAAPQPTLGALAPKVLRPRRAAPKPTPGW